MEKSRTHACMQLGPACTAHLHASFWGHIPCASSRVGQDIVSCPDQCHTVHISSVHEQLLLILNDGEPARLHFAALIHCTLDPHIPGHVRIGVTSYGLSEVNTNEGNLISRESSQHCPEIMQPPPIPIIVICYHPWKHGT